MSALDHQEGGTHYAKLKIQPIEYIHANGIGFPEGSVIKYVTRWRDKNGIADLKKARHFIDLLIELEEKNHILDATKKVWTHDKELPSSGIYGDVSQYTAQDMQAASLVHDAELDPALVELCSKTTIHADDEGWVRHVGDECPLSDGDTLVYVKAEDWESSIPMPARTYGWNSNRSFIKPITHWRYHKGE